MHSQTALLEKDISKQESFAGKRQDERNAKQSLQVLSNDLSCCMFFIFTVVISCNISTIYIFNVGNVNVKISDVGDIMIVLQQITLYWLSLAFVQTLREHV